MQIMRCLFVRLLRMTLNSSCLHWIEGAFRCCIVKISDVFVSIQALIHIRVSYCVWLSITVILGVMASGKFFCHLRVFVVVVVLLVVFKSVPTILLPYTSFTA